MNSEIILHYNQGSPYSERARLLLDYSGLDWFGCETSKGMPRPIQQVLVGSYSRRVPILQVGADIYCDAAGISEAVAELSNKPKLSPYSHNDETFELLESTETQGNPAILSSFSLLDFIKGYFKYLPFSQALAFFKDRKQLVQAHPELTKLRDRKRAKVLAFSHLHKVNWLLKSNDYIGQQQIAQVSSSVATNAFISGELAEASKLYLFAIEIAQQLGKDNLIAAYSNNLGVIYLLEGKFELANKRLMTALKTNEQHARISGTALSLNNLMLMHALQKNWEQFERVMYRADRSTRSLSSNDIAKYNDWVMFLYQLRNSDKVTNSAIKKLQQFYNLTEDPAIQKIILLASAQLHIQLDERRISKSKLPFDIGELIPACSGLTQTPQSYPFIRKSLQKKYEQINQAQ